MTDEQLMRHLTEDTLLNKLRAAFSGEVGRLEQAEAQRRKPTPAERRKMEFEAVERLLDRAKELGLVDTPGGL